MPPFIVVVIREDPSLTPKPVEGLRIALGLGAGDNPLSIVLLNESPKLLSEDLDEIKDVETLEKYLPSLQHLKIPFFIENGTTSKFDISSDFDVQEHSLEEIAQLVASADRTLVF